jgi:hypothetical protein
MSGVFSFLVGFTCGWAARSTVDTPQALGVKMFGLAYDTRVRLSRWAAIERERITDALAEARARCEQELASPGQPSSVVPPAPSARASSSSPSRSIIQDCDPSMIEDG